MKNFLVKFFTIFFVVMDFSLNIFCQHTVTLRIQSKPALHELDTIYVAGNFNDWKPDNPLYSFSKNKDGQLELKINNSSAAAIEFKFTRGSWDKAAVSKTGADIENNRINLISDTTINFSIEGWKDDFGGSGKKHTASHNVHILSTDFEMPQLNRTRRIWIYLPENYKKNKQKYPVLYMQDGQNLFDDFTSFSGEWNIDETLDSLIKSGTPPCIVVGIDNGEQRMTEYNPYTFEKFGNGEGDKYVDFIVKNLKPFVDKHYRTLKSAANTMISGSSMGGLISYYAMLKHPQTFGNGGIFSPSFWIADKIKELTAIKGNQLKGKVFFYIGALEGEDNVKNMEGIVQQLGANSTASIYSVIDPEGQHNEAAWRKWFAFFYKWVMADGFNNVIKMEN